MIAPGAGKWILVPMAISGVLVFLPEVPRHMWLSLVFAILTFFFVLFFRDPERSVGEGAISPADGIVVEADPARGHLAIFMNLHNVHVNRTPLEGTVQSVANRRGPHRPSYRPEARNNAQVETVLLTSVGPVKVRQIAGTLVRRIVTYVEEGQKVAKGQRIGMIYFGSRVEVDVPAEKLLLTVRAGDRVRAGSSTIGEVRS